MQWFCCVLCSAVRQQCGPMTTPGLALNKAQLAAVAAYSPLGSHSTHPMLL